MKDALKDANLPRTAEGRFQHLGVRPGEVANRIVTVGSAPRAHTLASLLDEKPAPFKLASERGFLTITGRYKGVPMSIVCIGMGAPNLDFFVRECRECVVGDMAIVRLGSCGGLLDTQPGTVVVPRACVSVWRNVDFDFAGTDEEDAEGAYMISKPVIADQDLHDRVQAALEAVRPADWPAPVLGEVVNASADSFYSSQGRQTSFPDHNAGLIARLLKEVEGLTTLEMETFHLYHLAHSWGLKRTLPVKPSIADAAGSTKSNDANLAESGARVAEPDTVIRVAAAQIVFASRSSRAFVSPERVGQVERWAGMGVLNALAGVEIERAHPEQGSAWAL
ncbi:nucleoside phosphorylase domain-containing protein [Schizophyllum amplum]|uniref:Nucleoside phosphorylase domain-containing protein n=1 Tax=Schizophyllum amplum TaxID=97359 RepID=A0A550C128_9AGAR|nr:nucleoside phosphorylase domain-containing protein [Auriculariopsis ampla]